MNHLLSAAMLTLNLKYCGVTILIFTGLQKFWGYEFDLLGSRDVIGHVIIGLGMCGFLLVVHWNHASILHRYGDIAPQI